MARIGTIHSLSVGTNVRSHRTSSASILSLIARLAVSALSISMRLVRMATSGYRAGYKYAAAASYFRRTLFNWFGGPGNLSSSSYPFWHDTLAQDPRDRIRFLRPDLSNDDKPIPRSEDLHILPFWTMMHVLSWQAHAVNMKSGLTKLGQSPVRSNFGFTVAAVPDDHWASGLVLSDTAWDLYTSQLDTSYEPPVPTDDNGQVNRAEWFKHLRIPEGHVPRFAHGYPTLSEHAFCETIANEYNSPDAFGDTEGSEVGGVDWKWKISITEPMHTFALPIYRVVEMTTKGGQMIYRDGQQLHASSITNIDHFDIPNEPPKIVTRANSRLNNVPAFFATNSNERQNQDKTDLVQKSWRENFSLARGPRQIDFAKSIVSATKQARLNWEDPSILSAGLNSGTADDLFRLIEWETRRLLKEPSGNLPRAFVPVTSTRTALKRTTSATRPTTVKSSPSSKTGARGSPAPPAPSSRPTAILHDSKGYYKILNVTPTDAFLDPKRQEEVQKRLSSALFVLKLMYQPHRQAHSGGFKALMGSMELAYNALSSLEKRKAYQKAGKD